MANLPPFPHFNTSEHFGLGPRWERWLNRFENFLIALNITTDVRKKALLLHYAGEGVYEVYETLREAADDYDAVKTKLTIHFKPLKHTQYHVWEFRQAKQDQNESLDAYVTRLHTLYQKIVSIMQFAVLSSIRKKSLKPDMDLKKLLEFGRTHETTDHEAAAIESSLSHSSSSSVSHVSQKKSKGFGQRFGTKPKQKSSSSNTTCGLCGGRYPHKGTCPAQGAQCYSCGLYNHFSRCCRSSGKDTGNQDHEKSSYIKPRNYGNDRYQNLFVDVSLEHMDDHMPAPDGTCGARTHDLWVLRHGLLTTGPSLRTFFYNKYI